MSAYQELAGLYDGLTEDVPYCRFADYYEKLFELFNIDVHSVIDLACGTGNMTFELYKRGYDMIAVDSSPDMLMVAREKFSNCSVMPLIICQSLDELDLYGTSDAAVCTLDGMNYLSPEEFHNALRRILFFINPGGLLIFDVNSPEKLHSLDGQIFLDETEDCYCVWRAEFDNSLNACFYGMDLFERQGNHWIRSEEEHLEYCYESAFVISALQAAGYCDINEFGGFSFEKPAPGEQRIFYVARKPK